MELIKNFSNIGKNDAGIAGGKGASLGEMTRAGIPVPSGFVVLADTFERFIEETDLNVEIDNLLHDVDIQAMHTIEKASEEIQSLIKNAKMPEDIAKDILTNFEKLGAEFVAVRSSATAEDSASAAWAGQLDSYLNTTKDNLLEKVQDCWASLFTPRAIFYRFEKDLHKTKISVAVVVQKMVNSEKSGIAFSVHPVTEDYNQIIIEAGFGLGEAIVSGQITPDSYVVEKEPRRIIDINVSDQSKALYRKFGGGNEWKELGEAGSKQVLSEDEILELSELILKIEKHYGFPCDIEWAYADNTFYIVQSRPITTLSQQSQNDDESYVNTHFIKMGRWATMLLDTETWHTVHTSSYFEERFGIWKEILAHHVFKDDGSFYCEIYVPESFIKRLHARIAEITEKDKKGMEKILLNFYKEKDKIKEEIQKVNPKNLSEATNKEIAEAYERNRDMVHMIVAYDQFTWLAERYWLPLMDYVLVNKVGLTKGSPEYTETLFALIKPYEISTTLEEKREVIGESIRIKEGSQTIEDASDRLAKDYGWMPVLVFGTPWDASHYVQELTNVLKTEKSELEKEYSSLKQYSQIQEEDIRNAVQKYKISNDDLQIFIDFGLAIDARNEAEYVNSVCGFYVLPLYKEISKRFGITVNELRTMYEDEIVMNLRNNTTPKELLPLKDSTRSWYLMENKERLNFSSEQGKELSNYLSVNHIDFSSSDSSENKCGITANKGKVQGIARLVPSPEDNDKVGQGEILIAYSTMVDNLPAMKKAGAIVTESGGITCHAAVVAREFGIPAIVSLKGAMTDFKDGDLVEVDAERGIVTVIERAEDNNNKVQKDD